MRLWGETLTHLKLLVATAIYHQHKTVYTKVSLKQSAVNMFFLQFAVNCVCVCSYPASPDFLFCLLEVWPRLRVIKVAWHFWFSCFDILNSLTNISNNSNQIGDSYIDLIFKAVLTFTIWCISLSLLGTCIYQTGLVGVCQQMLRLVSSSHWRVVDNLRSL